MGKSVKKLWRITFSLAFILCVAISGMFFSSSKVGASGAQSVSQLSAYADDLTMVYGASIYSKYEYGSAEETVTTRGIRYGMKMPLADYNEMLADANVLGASVNFGMFVKPEGEAYKYELSQINLFDNGALYYWEDNKLDIKDSYPTVNPTTGTPLYNDNGVYWNAEIYNISRPEIEIKGDEVYFYGFLVGFEGASSITRNYTCRGYVTITRGLEKSNVLANYVDANGSSLGRDACGTTLDREQKEANVSRSMAYVAQGVIEKNVNDLTLISQLESRYLTSEVKQVSTAYTVNYYLDGVKKGTKTLNGQVYNAVNPANITYDASFGYNCSRKLVTISNATDLAKVKLYANDKTVIDARFTTNRDFATATTYASDGNYHWKKCVCGVEDTQKTVHSGGTATFWAKANCSACETSYGDLLKGNDYVVANFDSYDSMYVTNSDATEVWNWPRHFNSTSHDDGNGVLVNPHDTDGSWPTMTFKNGYSDVWNLSTAKSVSIWVCASAEMKWLSFGIEDVNKTYNFNTTGTVLKQGAWTKLEIELSDRTKDYSACYIRLFRNGENEYLRENFYIDELTIHDIEDSQYKYRLEEKEVARFDEAYSDANLFYDKDDVWCWPRARSTDRKIDGSYSLKVTPHATDGTWQGITFSIGGGKYFDLRNHVEAVSLWAYNTDSENKGSLTDFALFLRDVNGTIYENNLVLPKGEWVQFVIYLKDVRTSKPDFDFSQVEIRFRNRGTGGSGSYTNRAIFYVDNVALLTKIDAEHDFASSDVYVGNANGHYKQCAFCQEVDYEHGISHSYVTSGSDRVCEVCSYIDVGGYSSAVNYSNVSYTADLSKVPTGWTTYSKSDYAHSTLTAVDGGVRISHANDGAGASNYYGGVYNIGGLTDVQDFTLEMKFKAVSWVNETRWFGVMYHTKYDSTNTLLSFMMNYRVQGKSAQSTIKNSNDAGSFTDALDVLGSPCVALSDKAVHTLKIIVSNGYAFHYIDGNQIISYKLYNYSSVMGRGVTTGGFALVVNQMAIDISSLTITGTKGVERDRATFDALTMNTPTLHNPTTYTTSTVTVIGEVEQAEDLYNVMHKTPAPQNTIFYANKDMKVTSKDGVSLGMTLKDAVLSVVAKTLPCIYLSDMASARNFIPYHLENIKRKDIAVMSASSEVIEFVRANLPIIRGVYDARNKSMVNANDYMTAIKTSTRAGANVIMLDYSNASFDTVRYIQARSKTVWIDVDKGSTFMFNAVTTMGAYGIVTTDFVGAYDSFKQFAKTGNNINVNRQFYNVAHRGLPNTKTENTLESCQAAYENGATHLEVDAWITKDGHVVLSHNDDVYMKSSGTKYLISENNLSTIQQCSTVSGNYSCLVPTVDAVFNWANGKNIVFVFEIKSWDARIPLQLKKLLDKYDMYDQIFIICFNDPVIYRYADILPEVPQARLYSTYNDINLVNAAVYNYGLTWNYSSKAPSVLQEESKKYAYRGYANWLWTYQKGPTESTWNSGIVDGMKAGATGVTNDYCGDVKWIAYKLYAESPMTSAPATTTLKTLAFNGQTTDANAKLFTTGEVNGKKYAIYSYTHATTTLGVTYTIFSEPIPIG